jgi:hypothetical protein
MMEVVETQLAGVWAECLPALAHCSLLCIETPVNAYDVAPPHKQAQPRASADTKAEKQPLPPPCMSSPPTRGTEHQEVLHERYALGGHRAGAGGGLGGGGEQSLQALPAGAAPAMAIQLQGNPRVAYSDVNRWCGPQWRRGWGRWRETAW